MNLEIFKKYLFVFLKNAKKVKNPKKMQNDLLKSLSVW